ncbi:hypothetical protein CC80DRAFT_598062 [Byssothecium circinans]|uniref:Uncharacterized protein n=1 Tax=Byssothecium circinans TaxID=147558 RepID=A0A6A5TNY8_9PLEO|nr:hypothetical protein CC80DRAFT_598062 [Byssothecium circinans]
MPGTQGETAQLTKPADWSIYMVTAALSLSKDTTLPKRFGTPDSAKMALNDSLNWHEAHDSYKWPGFSSLGFDFAQSMRLRRALVHDTFLALLKTGGLHVGGEGTPESGGKRKRVRVRGNERRPKRHCPSNSPNSPHDTNANSDSDPSSYEPFWHDKHFLAETMHFLIERSDADIETYIKGEKTVDALADIVHDGLVDAWEKPVAGYLVVPEGLVRKQEVWAKLVDPPQSSLELGASRLELKREGMGE